MSSGIKNIKELSAKKRALLEALLRKEGLKSATGRAIPRRKELSPVRLSFAQERLWLFSQLEPNTCVYNVPVSVRLRGPLNVAVLEGSLNEIVKRHEALRTIFDVLDGYPVQIVAPTLKLTSQVVSLDEIANHRREAEALRLVKEEGRRCFDLSRGPLLRATLLRLGHQEHELILTMHHIICDMWSIGVLLREVAALYESFAAGNASPLEELPIQYADFAQWQKQRLEGEMLDGQLSYWRQKLAGALPLLELPFDRPRPAVQTFQGDRRRIELSRALTATLKSLNQREGGTLFMALTAAFKALLYRYTNQQEIIIGTPVAGRNEADAENLIGFFVNTLVLRSPISADQSFLQLMASLREQVIDAFEHQDMPFEKLVEELRPERSLSHSPLFQVMFVFQNAPLPAQEFSGVQLSRLDVHTGTAKYDLTLELYEEADELAGSWEYSTELFDAATIERIHAHFINLLEAIAARPDLRIWEIPLLDERERNQLLVEWNDTRKDYHIGDCAHQLFEAQVKRTPDATAVTFAGERLSYAELNRRANQMARYLKKMGVGPETFLGVYMHRSLDMTIGLVAVLKAGAAYVPLDPAYPQERLSFMLEDAGVNALLTQESLAGSLPDRATIVRVDSDWGTIAFEEGHDLEGGATAQNLAYVIYTSGSTGKPKGVMITHGGLVNYLNWCMDRYDVAKGCGAPIHSPIGFDLTVTSLFSPLMSGKSVVMLEQGPGNDALAAALRDHHDFSFVKVTPAHLELLNQEWSGRELNGWARLLIIGGEALFQEGLSLWRTRAPDTRLINEYGPTETVVGCCVYEVKAEDSSSGAVPIGKPISNTRIYLLDSHLQPVPISVRGELYVGGAGVARGYLDHPDLTAELFIPDPFSGIPGARLYKTGDLARYLPDGNIEYLGRIDHQVKVRGRRIELGEIESLLSQHQAVRESAVAVHAAGGDKRLAAYIVPADGAAASAAELRDYLKKRLPDYMVPSSFTLVDSLRLTPNRKVDRRSLPVPEAAPREPDEQRSSHTPIQEVLIGMWSQILQVERIGINDNFFDLGGHSLPATRLMSQVRETFKADIPVRRLFEEPTIAQLAASVEAAMKAGLDGSPLPMTAVPRDQKLPLSFAQQRLWFLNQLVPDSSFYNVSGGVRLLGNLNLRALEESLGRLIERHEVLRTSFPSVEGLPVQLISPAVEVKLPVVDLRWLPQASREDEAKRIATEASQKRFDIARGPLFRINLLVLGDDDHVLLLTLHHIIFDAWSQGILISEMAAMYEAFSTGRPIALKELPIQYADFSVWQRKWLRGDVLNEQVAYWKKQLSGSMSVIALPTDRPRPAEQTFHGARQEIAFTAEFTGALKQMSRSEGATLFMVLLAGFKALLYRYTAQDDLSVGTWIANRTRSEIEGLIGFFANTLVLRTRVKEESTFRDLLLQVRQACLGAYAHQDLPFDKLVDELRPERSLKHNPLFQIGFALHSTPIRPLKLVDLSLEPFDVETGRVTFDMVMDLTDAGPEVYGYLHYNTDLFDRAAIESMLAHYAEVLEQATSSPDKRLMEISLAGGRGRAWSDSPSTVFKSCKDEQFDFFS